MIGDSSVWKLLSTLPTERESSSSQIITDHRITANGLAIRLCAGKLTCHLLRIIRYLFIYAVQLICFAIFIQWRPGPTGTISYAQVFKVPLGVNHFDLGDVLKLLERLSKEYSTVDSCRPDHLKKSLKVSNYSRLFFFFN